ncbi:leucine-rich repeat-containing protein 23-like [Malaya genurostris]|uniref:leucine-rich repeat-containing protein 23-like n=1 Tax=Malaya genurostris TaxID=325434 RepID=UPI0026F3BCD5|nr:leucine-rich repeat-containing protein 23-like [Malaya genurostris]
MHRPPILEMVNIAMDHLIVPPDLLLGNFEDNSISSIEVSYTKSYQISFLDLDHNNLRNINNISALINLETLHLRDNAIKSIDRTVFAPLIKLKRLYLGFNSLITLPWQSLSSTLVHLDCYVNYLDNVNFRNVSFPALEYLNINRNEIRLLNVTELLLATPKLKVVYVLVNNFKKDRRDKIEQELKNNNLTYDGNEEYYDDDDCYYDEEYVDGRCVRRHQGITVYKATLLSVVSLAVATLLVGILYWTYKEVNR